MALSSFLFGISWPSYGGARLIQYNEASSVWSAFSPAPPLNAAAEGWPTWGTNTANLIVPDNLNNRFLHFTGSSWVAKAISLGPSIVIYSMWGSSTSDIFASAGSSNIYHFDGSNWALHAQPWGGGDNQSLWHVHGSASNNVWVVGGSGLNERVAFWNGTVWTTIAWPTGNGVPQGVFTTGPNSTWIVTSVALSTGRIWYWNGTTWTLVHSTTSKYFLDIWGTDASHIWAIGTGGMVRYWNGATWATQDTGFGGPYMGIAGNSASNVYISGYTSIPSHTGRIDHFNGSIWTQQPILSPNDEPIRRLWMPALPTTRVGAVDDIFVVAEDVIEIIFSEDLVVDDNYFNTTNYIITSQSDAASVYVDQVLDPKSVTSQNVYLITRGLVLGNTYKLGIIDLALYGRDGLKLSFGDKTWLMRRTKVDSTIQSLSNMYDTRNRSNLRGLIEAIMISDEKIGGDY